MRQDTIFDRNLYHTIANIMIVLVVFSSLSDHDGREKRINHRSIVHLIICTESNNL